MMIQFVTSNEGKFREVSAALEKKGYELSWSRMTYPEVQTASLDEVVDEGIKWLLKELGTKQPFMIDDSGLFVPGLNDFPGVYSSYVFKTVGNAGILKLLKGRKDRSARFEARIGFYSESSGPIIFRGACHGRIAQKPRGSGGFGYDPIFIPRGEKRTFAEMGIQEKNPISHRGKALQEFLLYLERL